MLQEVKTEDEDVHMVAAPGIGILINPGGTRAASTGVPLYYVNSSGFYSPENGGSSSD